MVFGRGGVSGVNEAVSDELEGIKAAPIPGDLKDSVLKKLKHIPIASPLLIFVFHGKPTE